MNRWLLRSEAKALVFAAALLPFAALLWGAVANTLGPNPAEALVRGTGRCTLRFLCLTLAVTPLRQATGWNALARMRRMLGLFTFFYAAWHFLCFAWLDMGFDVDAIVKDIGKRAVHSRGQHGVSPKNLCSSGLSLVENSFAYFACFAVKTWPLPLALSVFQPLSR